MKTKFATFFTPLGVMSVQQGEAVSVGPVSYIIGGIIALLIMGYLIYILMHPEKF
jgi:K+-transporting ATPase KdpF subunit